LKVGDRVLGTLTVYRVASQRFSSLDTSLTGSFADSFALFWDLVNARRLESEARLAIQQLQDEHESKRLTQRSKVLVHQAKNGWREMQILLRRLESLESDGRIKEVVKRAQVLAHKELASLLGDDDLAEPGAIDVAQELRDLARSRQGQLRDAHIKPRFDISQVPLIRMPEHEFREVVNNLIANAIWAVREAKRTRGEIEFGAMLDTKSKREEVVIWISDNGVGIPRDAIPAIFNRGFTTSRAKGGTGLGLFLARSIVESYGGQIVVESRVNEYSRFEVRWPLKWIAA
jgi:signal transduction histidine kinase